MIFHTRLSLLSVRWMPGMAHQIIVICKRHAVHLSSQGFCAVHLSLSCSVESRFTMMPCIAGWAGSNDFHASARRLPPLDDETPLGRQPSWPTAPAAWTVASKVLCTSIISLQSAPLTHQMLPLLPATTATTTTARPVAPAYSRTLACPMKVLLPMAFGQHWNSCVLTLGMMYCRCMSIAPSYSISATQPSQIFSGPSSRYVHALHVQHPCLTARTK